MVLRGKLTLMPFLCMSSLVSAILLFSRCQSDSIPKEKYFQFYSRSDVRMQQDTLSCLLNNPLDCPVRFYISTSDSGLNRSLAYLYPVILRSKKDTVFKIKTHVSVPGKIETFWRTVLGDPEQKTVHNKMTFPFCKGKRYRIIQGYNGRHSHNTGYNRYAIDFNLKSNDTVCAADSGYVVGVIKDYKIGRDDKRLQDFANFITLYHPKTGLYTQYVHLQYHVSLVSVGDRVQRGQAIGLGGSTGWATGEHLHFNVLIPVAHQDIFQSVPVEFKEQRQGHELKENDMVEK